MEPSPPKAAADFGVIGLTEECKGILLEMHDLGYVSCVYDFDHDKVKAFLENEAKDTKMVGAGSLEDLINSLKTPRCILLLIEDMVIDDFVDVGFVMDDFIDERLLRHLSYQDYVINATSSGGKDSKKKSNDFMCKGIRYVGIKNGASVALLQGICICLENYRLWDAFNSRSRPLTLGTYEQKAAPDDKEKSCCSWGIDRKESYIDFVVTEMSKTNDRLMHEVDKLLSDGLSLHVRQWGGDFRDWSKGHLNSALLGKFLSRWRQDVEIPPVSDDHRTFVGHLKKAALACQVINYARGFASIREVAEMHQWDVDYAELKPERPRDYRYKCEFYRKIKAAFVKNSQLSNLLLDEDFAKVVDEGLSCIKEVISKPAAIPLNIIDDSMGFMEQSRKKIHNDEIKKLTVEEFADALEYCEDFVADKPLCAKLLDMQMQNQEPMGEIDLSSLCKYQYQLREVLSTIGKIEDTIEKLDRDLGDNTRAKRSRMQYHHSSTYRQVMKLHNQPDAAYEACMKHMEKDENVTALYDILKKKIDRVIEISKVYANKPNTYLFPYY